MIILVGRIPSKKNSRQQVRLRNGRRINVPSKAYKAWHRDASSQLKGEKFSPNAYGVEITFYMPDNRRADLTNKAESIMDLLVDNGILKDDSWQHIRWILLTCEGVDKENPRAEICIKESLSVE